MSDATAMEEPWSLLAGEEQMRPEPFLEGGLLELDKRWDEQAVFANQDKVMSAKRAPPLEAV
jgi:hypothetical protein